MTAVDAIKRYNELLREAINIHDRIVLNVAGGRSRETALTLLDFRLPHYPGIREQRKHEYLGKQVDRRAALFV